MAIVVMAVCTIRYAAVICWPERHHRAYWPLCGRRCVQSGHVIIIALYTYKYIYIKNILLHALSAESKQKIISDM